MDTLLDQGFLFWHWWVLGFVLLSIEIVTPGTFCMWVGFAAFATGLAAWLIPALSWPAEVMLFALLALLAVVFWFRFGSTRGAVANNGLNQRGRGYVGRVLTLSHGIVDGIGQARLEDSVWRVAGPNLPSGTRVRVVSSDGATLNVEREPETPHQP